MAGTRDKRTGRFVEQDALVRFSSRVLVLPDGCWLWQGHIMENGYGLFWANGRTVLAHRWAYLRLVGPLEASKQLDHFACDRRACVNPAHLRPVSARENTLRGNTLAARNLVKTHCPAGHAYSPQDVQRDGSRRCHVCHREREAARRQQRVQSGRR
jgi:hypothetical protein